MNLLGRRPRKITANFSKQICPIGLQNFLESSWAWNTMELRQQLQNSIDSQLYTYIKADRNVTLMIDGKGDRYRKDSKKRQKEENQAYLQINQIYREIESE